MAAIYVRFEMPQEVKDKVVDVLENVKLSGTIKRGTNEVTKAIERGDAKLIVIAEDVQPPEVVAHLPLLCEEKGIPYGYVSSKNDIGKVFGIKSAASVAVLDAGKAEDMLKSIVEEINKIKG